MGSPPPPKKKIGGNSDFFGQQEKFGQSQFLKMFSSFFVEKKNLFLPQVSIVKPVKFTRDSGCLARDELLVISKGDHKLIYIFQFFLFFGGSTVRHCTSWCCKLIRINLGITFRNNIVDYRLE